jgi:AcrR family transcriptional regulator
MAEKKEESAKSLQTKRILSQALMQLLEKQNFKKITVNDICQNSLISRSGFYLHFEDKYDLLRYCVNKEIERWNEHMDYEDIEGFLLFTLQSILDKKRFYYNTLISEPSQELSDIFQKAFSTFFTKRLEELQKQGRKMHGTIPIQASFYAGGMACSTIAWIRSGFSISIEEMAATQSELLTPLK